MIFSYKSLYLCRMKKYTKITSLLQIIVLTCFVISLYNSSALKPDTSFSTDQSADKNYFSMVPADLLCHSTQTESFARSFNQLPVTPLKNQLNIFLACTKSAELSHVNSFTRYIFYTSNRITWFRPVDIVFPSHYFW